MINFARSYFYLLIIFTLLLLRSLILCCLTQRCLANEILPQIKTNKGIYCTIYLHFFDKWWQFLRDADCFWRTSVCLCCKVMPAGNSIGVSCSIQKLQNHTCTAGHDWRGTVNNTHFSRWDEHTPVLCNDTRWDASRPHDTLQHTDYWFSRGVQTKPITGQRGWGSASDCTVLKETQRNKQELIKSLNGSVKCSH